ncbi:MAG: DUF1804 family protein [Cyclobacterium sp.]|uniref:DUF1804 family protein n=1 Tax=unclassified Cyclobacterium TaxID=2615055 RepID=UPI001F09A3B5|nr:DUF1804 family protein [Cyclobacterium sp. SYSU L10401]
MTWTAKITDVLGYTMDYLVKDRVCEQIDNETLKKLKEIQNLDPENKSHVISTIDAFIKTAKLNSIKDLLYYFRLTKLLL